MALGSDFALRGGIFHIKVAQGGDRPDKSGEELGLVSELVNQGAGSGVTGELLVDLEDAIAKLELAEVARVEGISRALIQRHGGIRSAR